MTCKLLISQERKDEVKTFIIDGAFAIHTRHDPWDINCEIIRIDFDSQAQKETNSSYLERTAILMNPLIFIGHVILIATVFICFLEISSQGAEQAKKIIIGAFLISIIVLGVYAWSLVEKVLSNCCVP